MGVGVGDGQAVPALGGRMDWLAWSFGRGCVRSAGRCGRGHIHAEIEIEIEIDPCPGTDVDGGIGSTQLKL